jgi:hypothetical protein
VVQVGLGDGLAVGRAVPSPTLAVVWVVLVLWPAAGVGLPRSPPELVGVGEAVGLGDTDGVGLGVVVGVVVGVGVGFGVTVGDDVPWGWADGEHDGDGVACSRCLWPPVPPGPMVFPEPVTFDPCPPPPGALVWLGSRDAATREIWCGNPVSAKPPATATRITAAMAIAGLSQA